jgi:hypothetical protein
MLAGITYTEISDQAEPEQGCPRLKSTYEITAISPSPNTFFREIVSWGLVRSSLIEIRHSSATEMNSGVAR